MIALGRGRRLAGAWAVPEDDMDEREVIVVVLVVHSFLLTENLTIRYYSKAIILWKVWRLMTILFICL